ncbi:hypothetical protein [Solibacillus merdavium]|uniref:Uncharacterized protein n=1 Tax=Solibacillus merdavium TaxID=2762218 RepID=A0ABR8XPV4_9BACL|nr:hypothetical protein [Solibacillus merdavium]MBD8033978.1 hypothetical protein [Solibacillus merdavium]
MAILLNKKVEILTNHSPFQFNASYCMSLHHYFIVYININIHFPSEVFFGETENMRGVFLLKYFIRILVALALCAVIWIVHPAREQVRELEKELSYQYSTANKLLRNTVEELLEWNFSQPITAEEKDYIHGLYVEISEITDLIFRGNVVHLEWKNRMYDIQAYLQRYMFGPPLLEEDVADLNQALQAILFITIDYREFVKYPDYGAMHDEKHEMVEKIKKRLETQY